MKPCSFFPGQLLFAAFLSSTLTSCGTEQNPSFKETESRRSVTLTVDDSAENSGDAVSADETSEHLGSLGEAEVTEIIDGAESGEEIAGSEGNAVVGTGDSPNTDSGGSGEVIVENSGSGESTTGDSGGGETGGGESTAGNSGSDGSLGNSTDDTAEESGWNEGFETPSKAELSACAKLNGIAAQRVKIAGNKNSATISSNSVVAIKMTGNQSMLDLSLKGSGSVAGLCLFMAGNKGQATVSTSIKLGNFIFIGRGNSSSAQLNVIAPGAVTNIVADLRGNQSRLTVDGGANVNCSAAKVNDKTGGFQCK